MISVAEQQFRYDAFISYSSQDKAAAKKIQLFLQSYRQPGSKRHLRIYLDETDITGGDLPSTITTAISQSRTLIVCCSPAAAASRWVSQEVRIFLATHNNGAVAPVLVAGRNADSLPGELNSREFRIHDVRRGLFPSPIRNPARDELLRLLSFITGRELRDLIDWRRRKIAKELTLASGALMVTAGGVYRYIENQKKIKLTDVRANLTLALMNDVGLNEAEQLNEWYAKDAEMILALYSQRSPTSTRDTWPWKSSNFPLHDFPIILKSRHQTLDVIRKSSTAGVWTTATRVFSGFSGHLSQLAWPDKWADVIVEARLMATEVKQQLRTQGPDLSEVAMSAFLKYYKVSKAKLDELSDNDIFMRPVPIIATLTVLVGERIVYESQGIPVSLMEHDEDARRLHIIHFPLRAAPGAA